MSCIKRISVHTHCNDLGGKVWNPAIRWTQKFAVFVVLEDDSGTVGIGECWCFDTSPDALVAFIRTELSEHIIGLPLESFETTYRRLLLAATLTARHGILTSALSGFDIAVWDIRAQMASKPLWALFNPDSNGCVSLYASGGLYGEDKSNDALAQEMKQLCLAGYSMVKMKIGGLTIIDDLQRINDVLDAIPRDCHLIVDGVYSYTVEQALYLFSQLPASRIAAFQSPLQADNIAGMSTLVQAGVPVMGTEAEYRHEVHQSMVAQKAVKYLQTAPIACGGYTRLLCMSHALDTTPAIELSLEVSSTAIALMAACHFGAAFDSVAHVELHTVHTVFFDQLKFVPCPQATGEVRLPDVPGLGIALPLAQVNDEFELT